jgi:class 3 adenylate cyclase
MPLPPASVLVVDDDPISRTILSRQLARLGHRAICVPDGAEALAAMATLELDLILLDLMMPRVDGLMVLEQMRRSSALYWIPVIVVSARDDLEMITRAIKAGADDHLVKPWNVTLLDARINAVLSRKYARDRELAAVAALQAEQKHMSRLLSQIFPASIVQRLTSGDTTIAEYIPSATVMFADLVNFTPLSAQLPACEMVGLLNTIFSAFDDVVARHGVETIKTQGDAYVVASGTPEPRADHAEAVAAAALDMQQALAAIRVQTGLPIMMRMGINSGPLIAGAIGTRKLSYDIWGDTVNVASRMESHGLPGEIQISAATYERVRHMFVCEPRGLIEIKGKGVMPTYLLHSFQRVHARTSGAGDVTLPAVLPRR